MGKRRLYELLDAARVDEQISPIGESDPIPERHARELAPLLQEPEAIRDVAERARRYASAAKLGVEAVNHATRLRVDAERKAGKLIAETPKQKPGQYQQRSDSPTVAIPPKISDLGISKQQSSDWQTMARMPDTAYHRLIDGRNRLAACTLAGVEPTYTTLADDVDVVSFVLSENVHRRHMKPGAIAMAVALMYVVDEADDGMARSGHLMPHGSQLEAAKVYGINRHRFQEATVIIRYAPHLTDLVLAGTEPISTAYAEARKSKDGASSMAAQMDGLRVDAPDLAVLVVEERLTLREALDLLARRRAEERRHNPGSIGHRHHPQPRCLA